MASRDSSIFYLKEDGKDISQVSFPERSTFVLGDHMDLSPEEERILGEFNPETVSLGKRSLHTYQAIVVANYELDRRMSGDKSDS